MSRIALVVAVVAVVAGGCNRSSRNDIPPKCPTTASDGDFPVVQRPGALAPEKGLDRATLASLPSARGAAWWVILDANAMGPALSTITAALPQLGLATMGLTMAGFPLGTVVKGALITGRRDFNGACIAVSGRLPGDSVARIASLLSRYGSYVPGLQAWMDGATLVVSTPWGRGTVRMSRGVLLIETLGTRCGSPSKSREFSYIASRLDLPVPIRVAMKGAPPIPPRFRRFNLSFSKLVSSVGYVACDGRTFQIQIRGAFRTSTDARAARELIRMGLGMVARDLAPSLAPHLVLEPGDPHGTVVSRGRMVRISAEIPAEKVGTLLARLAEALPAVQF